MFETIKEPKNHKNSENLYKKAIDSLIYPINIKDLEGRYLACNHEFLKVNNLTENEVIGKTAYELNVNYDADLISLMDKEVIITRKSLVREYTFKDITEKDAIFRYIKSPITDENGDLLGVVGISFDITKEKESEELLKASVEKYRFITENTSDVIWVIDVMTQKIIYLSRSVSESWGYSDDDCSNMTLEDLLSPEAMEMMTREIKYTLPKFINNQSNVTYNYQLQQKTKSGELIWVDILGSYHYDKDGRVLAIGVSRNIDERKKSEEALKESEEKYRMIAENASDTIWLYNMDRDEFLYYSPSVLKLRGLSIEDAMKEKLFDTVTYEYKIVLEELLIEARKYLDQHRNEDMYEVIEVRQPVKYDGSVWVEISAKIRYNNKGELEILGVSRNIDNRKKIEKEMLYLGYHDQLTGLFNRHYFEKIITLEMDRSDRYDEPLSMIQLDMDYFKSVNDTWGHPAGDDYLKKTAKIIECKIRSTDVIFRFGGEEFIVLMPHTYEEEALNAAEKIRELIENEENETVGRQTASLGVAQRVKNESFRHWYRRVDEAIYRAKENGRNRVEVSKVEEEDNKDKVND